MTQASFLAKLTRRKKSNLTTLPILHCVTEQWPLKPNHLEKIYLAPELLRDARAAQAGSQAGDVFAAAVVMHETLMRAPGPFGVDAEDVEAVEAMLNRLIYEDQQEIDVPTFRPSVGPCKL